MRRWNFLAAISAQLVYSRRPTAMLTKRESLANLSASSGHSWACAPGLTAGGQFSLDGKNLFLGRKGHSLGSSVQAGADPVSSSKGHPPASGQVVARAKEERLSGLAAAATAPTAPSKKPLSRRSAAAPGQPEIFPGPQRDAFARSIQDTTIS